MFDLYPRIQHNSSLMQIKSLFNSVGKIQDGIKSSTHAQMRFRVWHAIDMKIYSYKFERSAYVPNSCVMKKKYSGWHNYNFATWKTNCCGARINLWLTTAAKFKELGLYLEQCSKTIMMWDGSLAHTLGKRRKSVKNTLTKKKRKYSL